MKLASKFFTVVLGLSLTGFSHLAASDEIVEPESEVAFPKTMTVKDGDKTHNLGVTGLFHFHIKKRKGDVSLYTFAHYYDKAAGLTKATTMQEIKSGEAVKALTFSVNRGARLGSLGPWFVNLFQRLATPEQVAENQDGIKAFSEILGGQMEKKDKVTVQYIANDKVTVVLPNQETKTMTNPGFGKFFWDTMFSTSSPINFAKLVSMVE